MKKNFATAALPVLSLLIVLAAVTTSFAAGGAGAAAPSGSVVSVPEGWSGLLPVSSRPDYDNTSSIASSPLNAGVTVAWEERDEGTGHTYGSIVLASNNSVGAPLTNYEVNRAAWKEIGNVQIREDNLGRRHYAYYEYSGSNATCGRYGMTDAAGAPVVNEVIPNSCGGFFKKVAIGVGPDNSVHVVLGRDGVNLYYYQRNPAGQWVVTGETIYEEANANDPSAPTIAVATNGTVIAGWLQRPNGGGKYDVIAGRRSGPNAWVYENISAACCTGCSFDSNTYHPSFVADTMGGIRAAWIDEQCAPRTDPRSTDAYYREWVPGTGWDNRPIVAVDRSPGQQFWISAAVDNTGKAHLGYGSDADRGRDNYTFALASGSGTSFTAPERPYIGNGAFLKEPAVAHGPGYIFASFNSNFNAPQFKTIYYVYKDIPDQGGATPTPQPTNTPLPTATPLPPRCPSERFTDVCPVDFFYTPVLELDQRGVLGGYNTVPPCDGSSHVPCFKPLNNITRGQTAKVIALAAQLPSNLQGAPHFQDVEQSNPFYIYIEFSYNAGVITGYPCGGVGEPCVPPSNKPYFRPNAFVTRGQLSKMVATAFNLNASIPSNQQTFQDVAPNSTFWIYIERLAALGNISGYPCGGTGEPCVPPGNKPYFRQNNNVTRGQTAKIVYETLIDTEPTATPVSTVTATAEATATFTALATATAMEATATSVIPTVTLTVGVPTVTVLAQQ
jgi:hypothetical protein